jgi:hypothetical protein
MFPLIHFPQSFTKPVQPAISAQAEVPLLFYGSSLIVRASLNGQSGWFVLDSGNPMTTLAPGVLKAMGPQAAKLPYQSNDLDVYQVPHLRIGGCELPSILCSSGSPDSSNELPVKISGVLGYDALRSFTFGIDFDQMKAEFWRSGFGQPSKNSFFSARQPVERIPLVTQDSWPWVSVS